jgi:predicted MFS family arabinose efflux permease
MSIYQMSIMGGTAAGAALWGQVASMVGVRGSLMVAAASGVACMLLVQRLVRDRQIEEDLSPSKAFQRPEVHLPKRAAWS